MGTNGFAGGAVTSMAPPRLVLGGTCRRGHVLQDGDIRQQGNGHGQTCRICLNERKRTRYRVRVNGLSVPEYRCTTHYRCGHEKTPENTTGVSCRACRTTRMRERGHRKPEYAARQLAIRERNDQIWGAWMTGSTLRKIGKDYGLTHQRISMIVEQAGGVVVRMNIENLRQIEEQYPGMWLTVIRHS